MVVLPNHQTGSYPNMRRLFAVAGAVALAGILFFPSPRTHARHRTKSTSGRIGTTKTVTTTGFTRLRRLTAGSGLQMHPRSARTEAIVSANIAVALAHIMAVSRDDGKNSNYGRVPRMHRPDGLRTERPVL